jgi:transposase
MSQGYSTDLNDAQWERVRPFVEKNFGRPAQVERRRIVNAIFYILRTGCQWRMLPREFPHWSTVHSCYWRWRRDGTLEKLHDALRIEVRLQAGRMAQPSAVILDSQSVKTTEKGGQEATTKPRT